VNKTRQCKKTAKQQKSKWAEHIASSISNEQPVRAVLFGVPSRRGTKVPHSTLAQPAETLQGKQREEITDGTENRSLKLEVKAFDFLRVVKLSA